MKNKSKMILIMIMICSFSFQSFAQLSISDSSAFVTKSEFSADLNSISSRLEQVESSLDAKIDSLVSSYLTRNGIWNAAQQELKNYYIVDCCGASASSLAAKSITKGYRDFQGKTQTYTPTVKSTITYPTAMNSDNLLHKVDRTTLEIVTSCNKSGLLYITFNIATIATVFGKSDTRTYMTWIGGSTSRLTHVQWVMEFCANNTPFSRCNLLYQNTVDRDPDDGNIYLCYTSPFNTFKILTFVSKGDKITLKDYFEFKKNTGYGTLSGYEHAAYAGVIGTIDSLAIY